jgi:hypothetical protein
MLSRHCTARASLIVALLGGCGPEEPGDPEPADPEPRTCIVDELTTDVPDWPLVHQTEHLDIHVAEGAYVCAGSAIEYERHALYVADLLDIELTRTIPFYMAEDVPDSVDQWCGSSAIACTKYDGVVFGRAGASHHEITHGVACQIRTPAPKALAEGLAVSTEPYRMALSGDPREFVDLEDGFSYYYGHAGHFVRWLFEQIGPEAFRELYRTANYDDGVWTAMLDVYGPTLAEDYLAEAPAVWIPHRQCADVPVLEPTAEGVWDLSTRLDCDHPSTLGPFEHGDKSDANERDMVRSVLIEIPAPGAYRFARTGTDIKVWYERCLDEQPITKDEFDAEWKRLNVFFTFVGNDSTIEFAHAGWWRIDVGHELGPAVDIELTLDPVTP